jgi:hypothetical protein
VFVLVSTMLAEHQAWGERDCHGEKVAVKRGCKKNIKFGVAYDRPMLGDGCCSTVVDVPTMVCICGILTKQDIREISSVSLVRVARDCGHPLPAGTKCGSKCFILLFFLQIPCTIGHVD